MDSYAQHWRTFRFWNRFGILVVVALLPVVVFGAFLAQGSSDFAALPYLLVLMWLVAVGGVTIDLEFLDQGNAPIEYTAKVYHGVPK